MIISHPVWGSIQIALANHYSEIDVNVYFGIASPSLNPISPIIRTGVSPP